MAPRYHRIVSRTRRLPSPALLRSFDRWKPFRPYHLWYAPELRSYVHDTLGSRLTGFCSADGIQRLLTEQEQGLSVDHSRPISILLTLAHLLDYCRPGSP